MRSLVKRNFLSRLSFSTYPKIDSSKLVVELTTNPKPKPAWEELTFGTKFSDHMLEIDWQRGKGWTAPRIFPYQDLRLSPAAASLHYAMECFEGMKAYLDKAGKLRMFRPDMNMKRLASSMARLDFPEFDQDEFLHCIKRLLLLDRAWIPDKFGYSIYIRPTAISTHPFLGVGRTDYVKLYAILSPVGPYYPEGFKPVSLLADTKYVRAWPGGTGGFKLGSNYAGTILPQREAAEKGFTQILWLFGPNKEVTEVGTMNQFFFWRTRTGEQELITAPLDGTILPGVTRDSILQLTRSWNQFKVSERPYTIDDVIAAVEEKRMIEAFGAGTAAIVCPVKAISYHNKTLDIPIEKEIQCGKLTRKLADSIMAIQYGNTPHPSWSVIVD